MSDKTKLGLRVLEAAVLLGVLGDALLRVAPWGLNTFLWTSAMVAGVYAVARQKRAQLGREWHFFAACAVLFASFFAWRDSFTLRFLDALVVVVMLALAAFSVSNARMRFAGLLQYGLGILTAGFNAAFGLFPLLLNDIEWKSLPRTGWSRHVWAVMRGVVVAVPLLLVFGGLFMAADAVFNNLVERSFNINADEMFSHFLLAAFLAWATGGLLRGAVLNEMSATEAASKYLSLKPTKVNSIVDTTNRAEERDAKDKAARPAQALSLGIVETSVVLGLVNLLFLAFVLVQLRYFFGGAGVVETTANMSYAEYARRGFFELVTVTWLVLPLLLIAHWLLRKENPVHERIFRFLAGIQLALLFVIIWSAVGRMRLYQSEYGLTELRVYTTAFMGWLSLVFVWFAATALRGKREQFAFGALVAGCLVIVALHAVNPDALIARTNAGRAAQNRGNNFDAHYAASLSADATPELFAALPRLAARDRQVIADRLLARELETKNDWRTWNLSRARERRLMRRAEADLRALALRASPGSSILLPLQVESSPNVADANARRALSVNR
ncbi:MAG: DUF4173 domain-containing protein [Pyrinomonadaceae bacterium]|nr:DUF4173 domain-containing protein [Pyrinomonadaceae bacterium]